MEERGEGSEGRKEVGRKEGREEGNRTSLPQRRTGQKNDS